MTGLGAEPFDQAVAAAMAVYQHFAVHLVGNTLRTWTPAQLDGHLALSFGNRYLTHAKFADGEPRGDLSDVVDPFRILQPRLTTQVHTQENVVEYWEQTVMEDKRRCVMHCLGIWECLIGISSFQRIKPDGIFPGAMVELQIAFAAVKLGQHDYIFLPKLRAICVLSRAVQSVSILEMYAAVYSWLLGLQYVGH